jgi:hypothetical protein
MENTQMTFMFYPMKYAAGRMEFEEVGKEILRNLVPHFQELKDREIGFIQGLVERRAKTGRLELTPKQFKWLLGLGFDFGYRAGDEEFWTRITLLLDKELNNGSLNKFQSPKRKGSHS